MKGSVCKQQLFRGKTIDRFLSSLNVIVEVFVLSHWKIWFSMTRMLLYLFPLFRRPWFLLFQTYSRVPTQFSKPNSMTFPWPLLHFFHACLSDTYTCKLVTVLLKIADVTLMGSNSAKFAPCVVAVSHLKTKPTLLSISTSYLYCQIYQYNYQIVII